jgi:DNA-binding HxlR family transcriptional regulator
MARGADPGRRSPLAAALDAVGDRWTLLIVEALMDGPRRFGDLQEAVPGIAPNILTARLRQLEEQALVVATPYSQRPLRVIYELSAGARDLSAALRLLGDWGARLQDGQGRLHAACGTRLEARLWCPTCETAVEADEADVVEL